MRKVEMIPWLTLVLLFIFAVLASWSDITHNEMPPDKQVVVPDDIVQDLLTHLSDCGQKLSDLKWEVYLEEQSRRIVGATFKTKGSEGQDIRWYCLMVYEPHNKDKAPKRAYGAFADIDDPDFNVSGFSVYDVSSSDDISSTPTLVAIGLATAEKVAAVILETSAGRRLEATMYGRFWLLASPAVSTRERIIRAIGYAEDGTRLHLHYVFPERHLAQALPLELKIEAGLKDSDPLIREAWSVIQTSIDDSEEESRRIFAGEATRFKDAEITMLKLVDAFDSAEGKDVIEVYLLKYRTLPEDPSKVFLPGGMKIRDGWLLSQESMGDPYIVTRRTGGTITYIGTFYSGSYTRDAAQEFLLHSK